MGKDGSERTEAAKTTEAIPPQGSAEPTAISLQPALSLLEEVTRGVTTAKLHSISDKRNSLCSLSKEGSKPAAM